MGKYGIWSLRNELCTFIKAFESSPVHCEKSLPSGNRRSPGKAGTADILLQYEISQNNTSNTDLRSISWIMANAWSSLWLSSIYCWTHSTMWSLNVPFMSWCKRSGVRSSWISARGKPCVNGWNGENSGIYKRIKEHTTTSSRMPYSFHKMPGSKQLIRKSVFWWHRGWALGSSRLVGWASHLMSF